MKKLVTEWVNAVFSPKKQVKTCLVLVEKSFVLTSASLVWIFNVTELYNWS